MAKCWLVKSEETCYSIDDLARDGSTAWDGVRNYQARNMMRDEMKIGDKVLFYHSNSEVTGIVGTATVVREGYPDHTARNPAGEHFDPKATEENPIWMMVDIAFEAKFPHPVPLQAIKSHPGLVGIMVAQKGSRLSVQPVSPEHFDLIRKLGGLS